MTVAEKLQKLEASNADARRLATLVALAVRVDPTYLRLIRLKFLPNSSTEAELALWFSPLVKAKGYDGIVFHPDVSQFLRNELRNEAGLFGEIWKTTEQVHSALPQALKAEERIRYAALLDGEQGNRALDRELSSILAWRKTGGAEKLKRFATYLLPTLPATVNAHPKAMRLRYFLQGAGTILPFQGEPSADLMVADFREELSSLPTRPLYVHHDDENILLGGETYRGLAIRVPDVEPIMVEVRWNAETFMDGKHTADGSIHSDGTVLMKQVVHIRNGQQIELNVGGSDVEVITMLGEVYKVESEQMLIVRRIQRKLRLLGEYAGELDGRHQSIPKLSVTRNRNIEPQLIAFEKRIDKRRSKLRPFEVHVEYEASDRGKEFLLRNIRPLFEFYEVIWNDPELHLGSSKGQPERSRIERATAIIVAMDHVSLSNGRYKVAIEVAATKGIDVIPILLEDCDWMNSELGAYMPLYSADLPYLEMEFDISERIFQYELGRKLRNLAVKQNRIEIKNESQSRNKDLEEFKPIRVFISYSHKDIEIVTHIRTHFAPFTYSEEIILWDYQLIRPGENWDAEIKSQLQRADLIILLVNANFLASDYIWNIEMAHTLERAQEGSIIVFPILIKECNYTSTPLADFRFANFGKPLVGETNLHESLVQVTKEFGEAIEELKRRKAAEPNKGLEVDPRRESWKKYYTVFHSYEDALASFENKQQSKQVVTIDDLNALIRYAKERPTAQKWLDMIRQFGYQPNLGTYEGWAGHLSSQNERQRMFSQVVSELRVVSETLFFNLINASSGFEEASYWLSEMQRYGIKLDASMIVALIEKTDSWDQREETVLLIKQREIPRDAFIYNALIENSKLVDEANYWLSQMERDGIDVMPFNYNALIAKADSFEMAMKFYDQMKSEGLEPTVDTVNALLGKANHPKEADTIVQLISTSELAPNIITYQSLIRLSKTEKEARKWYDQMLAAGIKPDVYIFNNLIVVAKSARNASNWYRELEKSGIEPNLHTFNMLMVKSETENDVLGWLRLIREYGLEPDSYTYWQLILKSNHIRDARKWFEEMREMGIIATSAIYSALISKSKSNNEAIEWYERLIASGLTADISTLNQLIQKSESVEEAETWFDRLRKNGITPNVFTFNQLIKLSEHSEDVEKWFNLMEGMGLKPDLFTFYQLIGKSKTELDAKRWYERMTIWKIKPDAFIFNQMIAKSDTIQVAQSWFEQMIENGIEPNWVTYHKILSTASQQNPALGKGIMERLSKHISSDLPAKEAPYAIKTWLDAGGKPNTIRKSVSKYLSENAETSDARMVLKAWLDAKGNPEEVHMYLLRNLERHAESVEVAFALKAWLDAKGSPSVVEPHLLRYLERHAESAEARFALMAWLDAKGSANVVEPHLLRHLERHAEAAEVAIALKAWLDAKGSPSVVEPHLLRYLERHAESAEAPFALKAWLDAKGNTSVVEPHLLRYLERHAESVEAPFALKAWLDAKGSASVIEPHLLRYLERHSESAEALFALKAWLDAKGSASVVEPQLLRHLDRHAESAEARFVLTAWLDAKGSANVVEPHLLRYLERQSESANASFVLAAWFKQHYPMEGILVYLYRYLQANDLHPNTGYILAAILNGPYNFQEIADYIPDFLAQNPILQISGLVIEGWINNKANCGEVESSYRQWKEKWGQEKWAKRLISRWSRTPCGKAN